MRLLFLLGIGLTVHTGVVADDRRKQPISSADAEVLKQMDARIELVQYRNIQNQTVIAIPRNGVVKKDGKYFVMVSQNNSIDSFNQREFVLGQNWDADFLEAESGIEPGEFILVKNSIAKRSTLLTPTLVSGPKAQIFKSPQTPEVAKISKAEPVQTVPEREPIPRSTFQSPRIAEPAPPYTTPAITAKPVIITQPTSRQVAPTPYNRPQAPSYQVQQSPPPPPPIQRAREPFAPPVRFGVNGNGNLFSVEQPIQFTLPADFHKKPKRPTHPRHSRIHPRNR